MSFDYNEFGKKCLLDNVILEQARMHKMPVDEYYKAYVNEEFRKEICKDCNDKTCKNYKELFTSEINVKGRPC